MPDVTNDAIGQKFRVTGSNNLMVASDTLYSEHEHGTPSSPSVLVVTTDP